MIANKNTMKIIKPMQAMALMGLAGRAKANDIINHSSKFAEFDIVVVEDTPLEAGMQFVGDMVEEIGGKYYRAKTDKTPEEIATEIIEINEGVRNQRQYRFQTEADPLFFGWQRGENTEQVWISKVDQIRIDLPYVTN